MAIRRRLRLMAGLPALAVLVLPKCPLCLAAYGGLFAFAGVSALVVHPATIVSLAAASWLAMLVWALPRRRIAAFAIASAAVSAIVAGRFAASPWLSAAGVSALVLSYFVEQRLSSRQLGPQNPETHRHG